MKTIIYWFSGTGNSLAAAKALANRCGDAELVPMAKAIQNPPPSAGLIGLVFPVYSFGPPALVARFVKILNALPDSYIFSVVTYAGNKGGTLSILDGLLKKRGLDLAAGWGVKMPENYPLLGGAPAPERQHEIQSAAEEKIEQIAMELQQSPRGMIEPSPLFWRFLSLAAYPVFRRVARHLDRGFRVTSACNGCGICAKICPAADIEIKDGKPKWTGHCEQCFACFHWCPQRAVQFGPSAKQRRYHHPFAAFSDFNC